MRASVPLFFLLLACGTLFAQSQLLVNSQDWKDAYSVMLFGEWNHWAYNVVTDAGQGKALLDRMGTDQPVILVQSTSSAFISDYATLLRQRGFQIQETIPSSPDKPAALELGRRLNATSFIVLDGTYGYNAVSVIAQSLREKQWVLFSDRVAPADLASYLHSQNALYVLQYGPVKKSVRDALGPFKPDVIDSGDRFSNNIVLVKRMDSKKKASQVIFSDGRFIERTLFSSAVQQPIVLVGPSEAPAAVVDYLKSVQIPIGITIGPDSFDLGRWIKQNTPTQHIFVKFAQTFVRGPGIVEPWVLDQTFLPEIPLNVSIGEIHYNVQTRQLEVTYHNEDNTPTYLEAALEAFLANASIRSVPTTPELLLEPNATKSVAYDFSMPDSAGLGAGGNVSVLVTASYGAESGALDRQVQKRQDNLVSISFSDNCAVSLENVSYDVARSGFKVGVHNDASDACFLAPYLTFSASDQNPTLSLQHLSVSGQSGLDLFFYAPLNKAELDDLQGSTLHVHVDYGAREAFLTKSIDEDRLVSLQGASIEPASVDWKWIAAIAVVALVLFLLFGRREAGGSSTRFSARRGL